ncbi:MAG: hypothetical protein KDA87_26880 [Planctomycetales bacterium]|nr:hypothetical protein [Planctomycetales bacterium]
MARSIIRFVLFFVFLPAGASVAVHADVTVDEFRNGFDLPDWGRAWSGDMQFESDGIHIKNIGRLDQSVDVYRYEDIIAPLEFNSVVALRDLSLGDVDANSEITSFGRVTLRHRLDDPDHSLPHSNSIDVYLEESFVGGPDGEDVLQPDQWRFGVSPGSTSSPILEGTRATVPRGENVAIGLQARMIDGEVNIVGTYDVNIDDDVMYWFSVRCETWLAV